MRPSAHQLECFSAVMRLGTATAAANVLNTSQPSVTRALKQLEDATRLLLFERREGRLHPTAEARELMAQVEASFAGLERIGHAAEMILRRRRGMVRIGCLPAFAQGFIARATASFLREEPDRHVSLVPLTVRDLMRALRDQELDLGIVAFEVAASDELAAERFTDMNEIALLPPGHRLTGRGAISLADLDGEAMVAIAETDPYRRRMEAIMVAAGARPRHVVETATSHGVGSMVGAGLGVGIMNPITALDFLGSGVTMLRLKDRLPFHTTLVTPRRLERPGAIQNCIDALNAEGVASLERVDALLGPVMPGKED
jgi:DNA-binding transcriptional LysR family regulator